MPSGLNARCRDRKIYRMEVAGTVGFCAGPPPERRGRFAAVKALRARHRYARHRRFRQKCRSRVSCKTKKRRKEGKPELRYIELDILFSKTAEQTPTPQPESQGATSTCQQELAKKKAPSRSPFAEDDAPSGQVRFHAPHRACRIKYPPSGRRSAPPEIGIILRA